MRRDGKGVVDFTGECVEDMSERNQYLRHYDQKVARDYIFLHDAITETLGSAGDLYSRHEDVIGTIRCRNRSHGLHSRDVIVSLIDNF